MSPALPCGALMELRKLQLLASYGFLAAGRPLPFALLSLAFILALSLDLSLRKTGMRVVFYGLFHALGLAASFLGIYALYRGGVPDRGVFVPSGGELTGYLSILAACAVFWLRAAWLGGKTPSHGFCVTRFDEGLAEFLMFFSLSALIRIKHSFPGRLTIPYFLFGILALGLSKSGDRGRAGFARRSRITSLMPAAAVFALAAAGLILLMPALANPARLAAVSLKNLSFGLLRYIVAFFVWLFGSGPPKYSDNSGGKEGLVSAPPPAVDESSGGLFATIVMWCFIIVAAAFILALVAYILSLLFRRLSSRVARLESSGRPSLALWLRSLVLACAGFLSRLGAAFSRRGKKRSEALAAYARLLACGRQAGTVRGRSETPREYARRLSCAFPHAAAQADFVASSLEREIYGGEKLGAATRERLASVRRRLRAASFWAERVRLALKRLPALSEKAARPERTVRGPGRDR